MLTTRARRRADAEPGAKHVNDLLRGGLGSAPQQTWQPTLAGHVARQRRPPDPRMRLNISGKLFDQRFYGVDPKPDSSTWTRCAPRRCEFRPHDLVAGWSAYPRILDFAGVQVDRRRGRRQAVGGHGALRGPGRRAVCTRRRCRTPTSSSTTVHKTLGGPRSGLILGSRSTPSRSTPRLFPASRADR